MTVWSYIVQINNANENGTNNQEHLRISAISPHTDTTSFVSPPGISGHQESYVCSGIPDDGGLVLNLIADLIVAGVSVRYVYTILQLGF